MSQSFVGSTISIDGDVLTDEPLVVQGVVRGKIDGKQGVLVDAGGQIDAQVRAQTIEVNGEASGSLWASERIELRRDCKVTCQLSAPCVVIDEGSSFTGSVETHA